MVLTEDLTNLALTRTNTNQQTPLHKTVQKIQNVDIEGEGTERTRIRITTYKCMSSLWTTVVAVAIVTVTS